MPGGATTRRRLLVAAGTAMVAPGRFGGSTSQPRTSVSSPPVRLDGPLRLLAPASAVPPENRSRFGAEHDLPVAVRTVAPGAELIELLSSGYPADAVLARQDDIAALGALGLLADLDHDRIPNLGLVDSDFLDLEYDPKNRWSAPARFGTYGFDYRRGLVLRPPSDWAGFFEILPHYSLEGVSLLTGALEPVAAALAALGQNINTDDDSALLQAQALLVAAMPHVNSFTSNEVARFGHGELILAMGSSADFDRIIALPGRSLDTVFVLPEGRSEMWIDCWAVPAAGHHPLTAQAWIDHALSASAAARAWQASRLPAPERAAARLLPDALRTDHLVALDPGLVKRYQFAAVTPAGLRKRADIWERVSGA
ncbi:MAG: extracellular solute-binding protein [Gaiellales bacterium]